MAMFHTYVNIPDGTVLCDTEGKKPSPFCSLADIINPSDSLGLEFVVQNIALDRDHVPLPFLLSK